MKEDECPGEPRGLSDPSTTSLNVPGPLEVAGSPAEWLRTMRAAAGYDTDAALARALSVNQSKIFCWSQGVLPAAEHVRKLARVLHLKLPQAVKALWNESFEDPCPCGLKGKKIFPKDAGAKRLWMVHPCGMCGVKGTKRTYRTPSAKHYRLCQACTMRSRMRRGPTGSWLGEMRFKAGYPTAAALAQRLGITKVIVAFWERGINRPLWRHMVNLAKVLRIPEGDLVKRLWGEGLGVPCPCGCGGKTIAPDLPGAMTLSVVLPCVKCGIERVYKRHGKDSHKKLCRRCSQLSDRIEFTCIGYNDHGTTCYTRKCPVTVFLRPMDIHARQKDKERFPNSLFDAISKTFQCNGCGGAARLITGMDKHVRTLSTDGGRQNPQKIRSRKQLRSLLREYHAKRSPHLKATRQSQDLGRRVFAERCKTGKQWLEKTKANLVRWWSRNPLPSSVHFGLCLVCGKIAITDGPKMSRFHNPCYREWRRSTEEGREFSLARIQGQNIISPSPGPGRPVTEEKLRKHYSWAVQHYLGGKSFGEIGESNDRSAYGVEKEAKLLIARLPSPQLLAQRFRPSIELLIEAYTEQFPLRTYTHQ